MGRDGLRHAERLHPATLVRVREDRHPDVDDLDDPGDNDHRAEDPARDEVGVHLREDVHLGNTLLPLESLLEAGEREHAEEAGEADGHEPVHPLAQAPAPDGPRVHLGDDVVDHPHPEDREGAEQRQMCVSDDEVGEVRQPVERL